MPRGGTSVYPSKRWGREGGVVGTAGPRERGRGEGGRKREEFGNKK